MRTNSIPVSDGGLTTVLGLQMEQDFHPHVVQFYKEDSYLIEELGCFIGTALMKGDAAVVVATETHSHALSRELETRGVDIGNALEEGRYVVLDATETLSQIMADQLPDATRFAELFGGVVARAQSVAHGDCQQVVIFGEMVALLWSRGNKEAAIRLEQLWNDLVKTHSFSLRCAYPLGDFHSDDHSEPFLKICAEHSGVIPAEGFSALLNDHERLRSIAELQQKTQVFQTERALLDSEQRFRLFVEAVQDYAMFILDPEGRVTSWNIGAERIKGYKASEIVGKHFSCFYPEEDLKNRKPQWELQIAARDGRFEDEDWRVRKDGGRFWANVIITALRDKDRKLIGFAKITRDLTERKRSEILLIGEKAILEMIATGSALHEVLDRVARVVEEQSPGLLVAIMLLDRDGTHLLHGAAPSLPDSYNQAIHGAAIGPSVGSCGTAAYRKERVVVSDIASDPLWADFRELALGHGLRACWSIPIFSGTGAILGTFALYYRESRSPSEHDLRLIDRATQMAGIAIERRRVDEDLLESEERYRSVIEAMAEGVVLQDAHGIIRGCNKSAERILGLPQNQIVGLTSLDAHWLVINEDGLPFSSETYPMAVTLRTGKPCSNVIVGVRRPDKALIWTSVNTEPMFRRAETKPYAVVGSFHDITELKQAEKALRESEEKYRTLFTESRDALVITTRDGEIVDANQAAFEMIGLTKEDTEGGKIGKIQLNPNDRKRFQEEIERKGSVRDFEVRLRKKTGQVIDCLVTATVQRAGGGTIVGYRGIFRDITERKRAEESLRHLSGRLLTLQDEERRRLARELHDSTSQRLFALTMNLASLVKITPKLQLRGRKALSDSIMLADKCLREIRTISHLLYPPELGRIGLGATLRAYTEGFAKRSGLRIRLSTSGRLSGLSKEIQMTVFRVIQESLTNAFRHANSPTVAVKLARDAAAIKLEVADQGRGIPPKIYSSMNKDGRGLGVGILGMRERLEQFGGHLEITSNRHGTIVRAYVPVRRFQV